MTCDRLCAIRRPRSAFTLIEILVVITIIAILIQLALPAIQASRESARRLQCTNNLRQLSMACLLHDTSQKHLPTGGWSSGWIGDPKRGFDNKQPGGWLYNILPFLEMQSLHDMGQNPSDREPFLARAATPVPLFICPTRRTPMAIPYPKTFSIVWPCSCTFNTVAKTDYAACSGETIGNAGLNGPVGPHYTEIDTWTDEQWKTYFFGVGLDGDCTGVIYRRSMTTMGQITDGASNTYLAGEKYMDPNDYESGLEIGDKYGWNIGYFYDLNRWTAHRWTLIDKNWLGFRPMQDSPTKLRRDAFGSAHAGSFNMSFCDGSVRSISYGIDLFTHMHLGDRSDHKVIDGSKY